MSRRQVRALERRAQRLAREVNWDRVFEMLGRMGELDQPNLWIARRVIATLVMQGNAPPPGWEVTGEERDLDGALLARRCGE